MSELRLPGPTVTVFGTADVLDQAIGDELTRRGCSTHSITVPVGWLGSISHSVIRLDTAAGQDAMLGLMEPGTPAARVVAMCQRPDDEGTCDQFVDLCRRCAEQHGVSLVWYSPLHGGTGDDIGPSADLAAAIVDEVATQQATRAPSFATHDFTARPQRDHG